MTQKKKKNLYFLGDALFLFDEHLLLHLVISISTGDIQPYLVKWGTLPETGLLC